MNFTHIFKHYFRRSLLEPMGFLVLTLLPSVLVVLLSVVNANIVEIDYMIGGYNILSTQVSIIIMVMFQFFAGNVMLDWLYLDFKGARSWRLYAAPVSQNTFIFTAALATWIYSLAQGLFIIGLSALFLNAYWGNIWITLATLVCVSAMGQLFYILLFLLTRKKGTAEAIAQLVIWGLTILSGNFWVDFGGAPEFLARLPQPMALAPRAINYAGSAFYGAAGVGNNMGVAAASLLTLAAMAAVLAAAVIILGRRRSF